MAKASSKQEAAPQVAAPEKPKKRWPLMVAAFAVLVVGSGVGWYFMSEAPAKEAASSKPSPPLFISLEPFTVNLQPDGQTQYLQVGLVLKTTDPKTEEALKQHMPEVRNRILLLLSSKHGSELLSVEGKQKLASEIQAQMNKPFGAPGTGQRVDAVLFTSFVIQ